jgi:hypothetical protein
MDLSLFITPLAIILVLSAISLYRSRYALTSERAVEIILTWAIVVGIGLGGLTGFVGHAFMADQTAEKIGWPIGSPFQREVAFANLAFGILGLMSFWLRKSFWLATIVGFSIFMLGAAYGHVYEATSNGNYAAYNAGAVLYWDILLPVILIALWVALCLLRKGSEVSV